ncbi:hypothetical protein J3L18_05295 [Mucilaginibacter gossypii]|uniref:hypothetical protein n=1 Tax=Mucilaginibacter gossypii TaxID=551996 RepID=UPI000DCF6393|nr:MULTISPECIES: hypothetical protein [Mucilaginibacter]QTE38493.1 hypothetical protein J3L18_05295 [Mucilaginibacter gossypii]RAV55770.1 hypothetical protein DIU36_16900 [Mucilaginibacter rubeus]
MRKFYKGYFEQSATANVDIAHTPESKAFFYIKDIYNPDEFDKAIRNLDKNICFLLENPSTKGRSANRNKIDYIYGRFDIVGLTESGDSATIEAMQDQCEDIANEFLAKMSDQFLQGGHITVDNTISPKVFFPEQETTIDPIGPISTNYWGVSVGFYWKVQGKGSPTAGKWV